MLKPNSGYISIHGASQNNLKNISVQIPLNQITVITGVSGSGKSSLAFDTIYAEGQRRYVETFSSYARQFLDRMDKPKVDRIDGIPPAIAIDQTNLVRTSRSTVGTMTEISDHLKLLFARAASLYCHKCGKLVSRDTPLSIYNSLLKNFKDQGNKDCLVTFTIPIPDNFTKSEVLAFLNAQGYTRFHKETETYIEVIQDRLSISEENRQRLIEDFETALKYGNGKLKIYLVNQKIETSLNFSSDLHCADCDIHYKNPEPNLFSFNSPLGACEKCKGFGRTIGVDYDLVIPDDTLSIRQGAIKPWRTDTYKECLDDLMRFAKGKKFPLDTPWKDLQQSQRDWVITGDGEWEDGKWYGISRFFQWLETKNYKMHVRVILSRYRSYNLCSQCHGSRLKMESLWWKLGSNQKLSIHEISCLSISESKYFFDNLHLPQSIYATVEEVIEEIKTRLGYLCDVGLGYLSLDRQSRTLSGGEVQRINLTTALGTSLVNTLFILDEPSIGLHSRDIRNLISVIKKLRDKGNTVLIVEHDPELINAADQIIELGPGPGEHGGNIVYQGSYSSLIQSNISLTSQYLTKTKRIHETTNFKYSNTQFLKIVGASEHNLKNIDIHIPLNGLVCLSGVSGSGKSTILTDILYKALQKIKNKSNDTPGLHKKIINHQFIDSCILVDQSPIGKTTRSNPVSYIGAFDNIRKLFAKAPLSKKRGYTASHFSFNSGTGRCPTCNGTGFELVEMQFLSDIYLRCPDCDGKRFRDEILEVKIFANEESTESNNNSGKSISDILDLTVTEAISFFKSEKDILKSLNPLEQVGLNYLRLGQPLPTLSGGEAQRLKLAAHIADGVSDTKRKKGTLFLFDEPTTGLHFQDIECLLKVFRNLIEKGHSLLIIEHNLDILSAADWIIDIGPEGGEKGGNIVVEGDIEAIKAHKTSFTGEALRLYHQSHKTPISHVSEIKEIQWSNDIVIQNAREHNLKNISISIPRDTFTVITGVSGSGKSTVAFDILFAEGQRRYLESLNAYARQFVQVASRPDVDSVSGIPPTVAIEQRTSRGGRKSTVATTTEIYHFLRLLFAKAGTQYCPDCNVPIEPQTKEQILSFLLKEFKSKEITFLAPLVVNRKGIYTEIASWAQNKGYQNLRVDGKIVQTDKWPKLDRFKEHSIELILDTILINARSEKAILKNVELGLQYGNGVIYIQDTTSKKSVPKIFSINRTCPSCHRGFDEIDPRLFSFNSKHGWCPNCFGTGLQLEGFDEQQTGDEIFWNEWWDGTEKACSSCKGTRLKPEALSVLLHEENIASYTTLSIEECLRKFTSINWSSRQEVITHDIVKELITRLNFLHALGLSYLTLNRAAPTLSGGEAQRIRLAAQLGSNLKGVCYILDEPTIGLHSRDNDLLLSTLHNLKNKGNTIVIVEHDEDTIRSADYIIDLGPRGGKLGGNILASGTLQEVISNPKSITGKHLKSPLVHTKNYRPNLTDENGKQIALSIKKATLHNLKNLHVDFPLGKLISVSGVSGSGKSTLVRDILFTNLANSVSAKRKHENNKKFYGCESINGIEHIKRVLEVDQTPIGKTPRSCPATYIGFWDEIRNLLAKTPEAIIRGYTSSRFSFNVDQGRCPECDGQGMKKIEMSFLPDVSVTCESCKGARFTRETLEVLFKEKNIGQILAMSVDEAVDFFTFHASIHRQLKLLQDVGLGYLTLGQQSPTLSGGEAQRIKLVAELSKIKNFTENYSRNLKHNSNNHTVYILDEPTVGLHTADVEKLLHVFHRLVDSGNTIVVVEHNLDILAESDWIIDLGPEGGTYGGEIIAQGTPKEIIKNKTSYTAKFLKRHLQTRS